MYCFHLEATGTPFLKAAARHGETSPPVKDKHIALIDKIHDRKMKAGVAISPDTPSTAITDEIANAADMLLVMTVYPGNTPFHLSLVSKAIIFFS